MKKKKTVCKERYGYSAWKLEKKTLDFGLACLSGRKRSKHLENKTTRIISVKNKGVVRGERYEV